MAIVLKTSNAEIMAYIKQRLRVIDVAIIRRFAKMGEEAVNMARTVGNYTDRTKNLRNSIGYVISHNGVVVNLYFPGKEGEGKNIGKAYAINLASKHKTGYALIVVAGKEYALHVESRNYDVLSSTEHQVQANWPIQMRELIENINKAT